MPPSAKRAGRGRRDSRKDVTSTPISTKNQTDIDTSSPSRPAKRRKKVASPERSAAPTSAPGLPESHDGDGDNDNVDYDDEEQPSSGSTDDDDQLVSRITQQLKAQPVQASKDHSNSIHEANGDGVKAYAKIAAHDWTFYITKTSVNIGRAPETAHAEDDQDTVHIDLGPSKMVSRNHASIAFDSKDEKWLFLVKGRNGAKIDGQPLRTGVAHTLTSGEVIEIANVEMIFVLPAEIISLRVHPTFLQRCGLTVADTRFGRSSRRQPLIAPAPPDHKRPGTPPHPSSQAGGVPSSMSTKSPAVVLGPNSGVDLSLDDNQHIKPQYSYAQMITQAILNAPDGRLNLNGIYTFIMNSYSYYRHQQAAGWQNSIRHNLSLNKAFDKVARSSDEPGKGMKWQIVTEAKEEMVRNAFRVGRGGHRGSSAPSSPNQLNYITQGPKDMASREPPSTARKRRGISPHASPTPRPARQSLAQSTPVRQISSDHLSGGRSGMTADGSPLPRPRRSNPDSSISSYPPQSPTLTSSYLHDEGSFVTPAPPRVHPKLAPPSTAQRPSQHMPTSSPAPFWRYADIGSTPLRPSLRSAYEASPSKPMGRIPQSSSPPAEASPRRAALFALRNRAPKRNLSIPIPNSRMRTRKASTLPRASKASVLTISRSNKDSLCPTR
jgi:hypothetical protein